MGGLLHALFIGSWWPPSGRGYAFWSSIGSDFGEITIAGGVAAWWHHVNCHTRGCWRIGREHVDGTTWVVCRRHHPDGKPTHHDILRRAAAILEDRNHAGD